MEKFASRRSRRCVGLLALICILGYLPSLMGLVVGHWPISEDAIGQFSVWRQYARQGLQAGTLPLWNPYSFCGMPFLSNGQTAFFYPGNLVYWLLPARGALYADALLHSIFLATGTFALARCLGQSRAASCLAAAGVALSGSVAGHIFGGHMTWHATYSYLPWLLWAALKYLKTGDAGFARILLVFMWLQVLSGYPPLALLGAGLVVALVFAWVTTRWWQNRTLGEAWLPPGAPGLVAGFSVLLGCLAAATVLPLREVSNWSVHGSGLEYGDVVYLSGSWRTLVRMLMPSFFGGDHGVQWSLIMGSHEEDAYGGLLPLLLALGSPWIIKMAAPGRRLPVAIWWLWATLAITGLLAMGGNTPIYRFLYDHVIVFRMTRVPLRWLCVWVLAAALLAGFSFDALFHRPPPGAAGPERAGKRLKVVLTAISLLLLGTAGAAFLSKATAPLWMKPAVWSATRAAMLPAPVAENFRRTAILEALITLIMCMFLLSLLDRWRQAVDLSRRRRLEIVLLLFIGLDMTMAFWREAKLGQYDWMRDRVLWPQSLVQKFNPGQRWDTAIEQNGVNQSVPLHVDSFNGYDPISGRRYFEFVQRLEGRKFWEGLYQPRRRTPLLDVAAVTHTLSSPREKLDVDTPRPETADMTLEAQERGWTLWRHRHPWPRAYLSSNLWRGNDEQQLDYLERFAAHSFETSGRPVVSAVGTFVGLPGTDGAEGAEAGIAGTARFEREWNRVHFAVQAIKPAVLVDTESNYPGWEAYINGRQTRVETVNYFFRGIQVPAGKTQVELVYNPHTYRFAIFVSLCALSVLAVIFQIRPRHNAPSRTRNVGVEPRTRVS